MVPLPGVGGSLGAGRWAKDEQQRRPPNADKGSSGLQGSAAQWCRKGSNLFAHRAFASASPRAAFCAAAWRHGGAVFLPSSLWLSGSASALRATSVRPAPGSPLPNPPRFSAEAGSPSWSSRANHPSRRAVAVGEVGSEWLATHRLKKYPSPARLPPRAFWCQCQ